MMLNRNLELFIRVAEYGSITKVAKAFYITQPAVSNAIAKLEDGLGVELFFRDRRNGLVLTDVGKQVLIFAKQMEDADNRICQCVSQAKHMIGGRVRIAVLTSLVSAILSKALREYRALYPGIDIEIREGTPNDIFAMVEEYGADFAISCAPFGRFDALALVHDRMMAMFPPGSPAGTVALDSPPELLIINRPAYETIVEHTAPEKSIKFDKIIVVENAETAIQMVRDGVGAGILSEYTMKTLAPDAPCHPVTPQITFDIGLFANDLRRLPPAAAELVRIIRRNAGILDR